MTGESDGLESRRGETGTCSALLEPGRFFMVGTRAVSSFAPYGIARRRAASGDADPSTAASVSAPTSRS
jgi:hypothetical protein